jgi:hypothetical protein
MRPCRLFTARWLWLFPLLALSGLRAEDKPTPDDGCRFGTKVKFVDTPSEAARLAAKEEKLVLVLHVSGYFEDPRFT